MTTGRYASVPEEVAPLEFRGGKGMVFVPLLAMIAGVTYLSLNHASLNGFWVVFLGALSVAFVLARDADRFAESVVRGLSNSLFAVMTLGIIFASIIGQALSNSGLVESMAHYAANANVTGSAFTALTFLIAALVGVSTGSAGATILTAGPILYPIGYLVGADPAFLLGAIISGGAFGDNLAPIGNTTIASATTQDAEIGAVVRSRLKYSLPCAAITALLFLVLTPSHALSGAAAAANHASGSPSALWMLLSPVVVVVLAMRRRHLLVALFWGIIVALGVGLIAGRFGFSDIMAMPEDFKTTGIVLDGITNSLDLVVGGLFLFPLINVMTEGGITALTLSFLTRFMRGVRSAEASIAGIIIGLGVATTTDTMSIIVAGPMVKEIGREYKIGRNRRANLMDCASVTASFLMPYGIAALLGALLSEKFAPVKDAVHVSPASVGLHTLYCWVMLAMLVFAIATGYGSVIGGDDRDSDPEPDSDGPLPTPHPSESLAATAPVI